MKDAKTALIESMNNKARNDGAMEIGKRIKHEEFLKKFTHYNEEWIKKCKITGERIIDLMVEQGKPAGKQYKSNTYYGSEYDKLYGHPRFEFNEIVSDDAINTVIDYFNDLGYGCEIVKAYIPNRYINNMDEQLFKIINDPYINVIRGTMYLWFKDDDKLNGDGNNAIIEKPLHNVNGEISW